MEAFGIDFGTTNSAAVGYAHGALRCFGHDREQPLPSVLAINRVTGEVQAVGRAARERREELSEQCEIVRSVKSLLGDPAKSWNCGATPWTPERVAAEILQELRRKVEAGLPSGERFDTAVCSIPVGFPLRKRQALRQAAKVAGITVKCFIPEPTAAVCRHFKKVRKWPTVAVFDWGGGTLDISVVQIERREVHELATFGVPLGGDDIDRTLAQNVHGQIATARGLDLPFDAVEPRSRDRLMERVEAAKCRLASEDVVEIELSRYQGLANIACTLSAEVLTRLLQPVFDRAWQALKETVEQRACTSFEAIGCVLMVGGSSRLRGLQEFFYERGSPLIESPADADWNIAQGAAMLSSTPGRHIIARPLGLQVSDGSYCELLSAGAEVDERVSERHFGLVEDSREARLVFVQPRRHDSAEGDVFGFDSIGQPLSVPAYGFSDEPITLRTRVNEDLVVEVEACSAHRGQAGRATWTFEQLALRYRMPE